MMTVPQKKYFCNRIDEITAKKERELRYTEPVATDKELCIQGMDEGKIVVKNFKDIKQLIANAMLGEVGYSNSYMPNIDSEKFLKGFTRYIAKRKFEHLTASRVVDAKVDVLRQKQTQIKDVAMFGNSAEAHILLNEFVNFDV